jgi:hypothetical protein
MVMSNKAKFTKTSSSVVVVRTPSNSQMVPQHGWSISREPTLKKQRTSSSDGATFWHQLLQMEMAAQEAQALHRLETWSNEALCQEGSRLQGMEATLKGKHKLRILSLRRAGGAGLPNNTFSVGDMAMVSSNEPESMAVRMGMH